MEVEVKKKPQKRQKVKFPELTSDFNPDKCFITKPTQEEVHYIQLLNDRKGDDKWLGWLHKTVVSEAIEKDKGGIFVIRDKENQILGFLHGNCRRDGYGKVYQICVQEEFRQYGLAFKLMKHFYGLNEKGILLKVMHLNFRAVTFFQEKLKGKVVNAEINKKNNVLLEYYFEELPELK